MKGRAKIASSGLRINGNIRGVREVRLIDHANNNIGVVGISYAQERADAAG